MTTTPPHASTSPPDAGTPTRVTLVALLTALTLELVRVSGPLLDRSLPSGVTSIVVTALGTYAAAGVVAAALLLLSGRRTPGSTSGRTVLIGTVLLAVARLTVQALDGRLRYGVGLATVAITVAVLALAVAFVAGRPTGGRQAALGLVVGTGLSTGLQLALGTWDVLWRHDVQGWVITAVLAVASIAVARAARAQVAVGRPRRLWALGPFLALAAMVLANPAFAASQAHVSLRVAGLVLVGATVAAAWGLLNPHLLAGPVRITAAIGVPIMTAAVFFVDGRAALAALALLEVGVGIALAGAMSTRRPARLGVAGTAVAAGVVGLGAIVPLLVYLVDYQVPLPVDNAWVPVLAGVALAIGGLRRRTPTAPGITPAPAPPVETPGPALEQQPFRANAVRMLALPAVVLALIGGWASAASGDVPERTRADTLSLLTWNLHYGVAPTTNLDLEQVARTIEQADPDVVLLQEVARGWVLGGGADMATWLSHRLDMQVVFAPAADQQFGNAILARSALSDAVITALPYGDGPQERSAVTATVTLADGTPVRLTSVHLQHRAQDTPTRLDQLDVLLAALPADGASVLAGDLNAAPGSAEVELVEAAGWVSAIDLVGDPASQTFPSDDPQTRIDWVFARDATPATAQVLDTPRSSDHLPVLVTLAAPD